MVNVQYSYNPKFPHRNNPHGVSDRPYAGWWEWPSVKIEVFDLPFDITTYELHQSFSRYGVVDLIIIREDQRDAGLKMKADIRFKSPPKRAIWSGRGTSIVFRAKDANNKEPAPIATRVRLSKNQHVGKITESRSKEGVSYPSDLSAKSIQFGVMTQPTVFMPMQKADAHRSQPVKLTLLVERNELEVTFPCHFQSDTDSRYRDYRFLASLDSGLTISEVKETEDTFCLLLTLKKPPPYSKKILPNSALHHDQESKKWQEEDMWFRQTDLALTKAYLMRNRVYPVGLVASPYTHVNLGRWLAYCIEVPITPQTISAFRLLQAACLDRNVPIDELAGYEEVPAVPSMWQELRTWEKSTANGPDLAQHLQAMHLDFTVRYWLDICASQGLLNEYCVDKRFLVKLSEMNRAEAIRVLENLVASGRPCTDHSTLLTSLDYKMPRRSPKVPENCVMMHSATVTATTIRVNPPAVEISNRIVRQYQTHADRFLRIRFEDDEYRGNTRIFATTNEKMAEPFVRIKRAMLKGIDIAGRHYEFLAWGNSQLREHGAYFFCPLPGVISASKIVALAGEFDHESIIAKRAARLGQCFSTTKTITGRIDKITKHDLIEDIERGKWNFSDGCGQISPLLAAQVAVQLKITGEPPSAYQFRLGGSKGVLAVTPELRDRSLRLRKSQYKFPSESEALEIIRPSEFWTANLNRQLILVLSALGIPSETFIEMQTEEVRTLDQAMKDDKTAIEALYDRVDPNRSTPFIADLVRDGFRSAKEPFVLSLLHLWRAWSMKYLKEKAQIRVSKGALIMGCIDETATLRGYYNSDRPADAASKTDKETMLPEVFVQITDPHTGSKKIVTGKCIIARNPSLHIGDIRVCRAVDAPQLHHLRDVLVLPQTGDRDLSSMCSGGDLDGDDYVVIWDERLIPPEKWFEEPFDYTPPEPVRAVKEVTQSDYIQFYHQYMKNDFLGQIATAHLIWADYLDDSVESHQCLELTNLHSMAVDYPKTGRPAKMPKRLQVLERPHFMEYKTGKTYHSKKVLGNLYDMISKVKFHPNYECPFDQRILNASKPDKRLLRAAGELKEGYDESMRRIMAQHEIKTEFEVFSTFCLDHSKATKDFKFHEELGRLSKTLRDSTYQAIVEEVGGEDHESLAPFAVAAYQLVESQLGEAKAQAAAACDEFTPDNMPMISFPWVLHETLGRIARDATGVKKTQAAMAKLCIAVDKAKDAGDDERGVIDSPLLSTIVNPWTYWSGHGDPFQEPAADTAEDEGKETSVDAVQEEESLLDSPIHVSAETSGDPSEVFSLSSGDIA